MAKCAVIIPSDRSAHAFEEVGQRTSTRACLKLAAQTSKARGKWVRVVRAASGPHKASPGYGYMKSIASCLPRSKGGKRFADCSLDPTAKRRLKRRR